MRKLRTTIVGVLPPIIALFFAGSALAHGGNAVQQAASGALPPTNPDKGLVYAGLNPIKHDGLCPHAFKLRNINNCTHGPDPAPKGVDVNIDVAPISASLLTSPVPKVRCDGDGVSGKRVQVIYAHASDVVNRIGSYVNSFRQWAADADLIYRNSGAETHGERHIRFVHDASCVPSVTDVTLSATGDDSLANTQRDL